MEKKEFKISINAPKERVWEILWDDSTYRQWTSAFSEGSYALTDWKKGSKALFLGSTGDGMVSTIADNIPNEYMSIMHLGEIKDGVEDTESGGAKAWAGSMENYTLKTVDSATELTVDMDIAPGFMDYFMKTWPKALEKLKTIAES